VLLLVDAAAPRSGAGLTAAFARIGTVHEPVTVNHADCCILMNASASTGAVEVAGLDDFEH
jgi:hypothetical protein